MIAIGDLLKKWWFIITAIIGLSTAWGANTVKINNLEDAVKSNAATQAEVSDLRAKSSAVEERTKAIQSTQKEIQDNQQEQQRLLHEILLRLPRN